MLKIDHISGGYPGHQVLADLSFAVEKGEIFGILGPNGSGKTTLLRMISGLLHPKEGEILLQDRSLKSFTAKELAKKMAVLPQIHSEVFAYTVRETVSLGRYAHQKGLFHATDRKEDKRMIEEAMKATGVYSFQHKLLQSLSGGERQRVFLAQALAQNPEILLLDEPTNHLDLAFQKELLDQLKKWVIERGLTVLSIFHDLNIASLYCDRVLLMDKGNVHAVGNVEEVIQKTSVQKVYQTEVEVQTHPIIPKPQIVLLPNEWRSENDALINEKCVQYKENTLCIQAPGSLKVMDSDGRIGWESQFKVAESLSSQDFQCGTYGNSFIITWTDSGKQLFHHSIFINGFLSDEGYIRAVLALSEIKTLLLGKIEGKFSIAALQNGQSVDPSELRASLQEGIKQQLDYFLHFDSL
ncbi:putative ABC transporter ATP-binding protein YvrA [Bacillus sp. J14TS2]|uniref:ABC transporter ATP-binding protein n=1 Tax=Bacillus sp. J14TS2 TaxID=2807188 RepID=UPI001B05200A|nr:ABC transporter ATP-binding protein [Bacillus sp. J14TS2]GIN69792.1 putative ABC transporter ATP-binding protein YvrA [Bacillus sp. J14TS2]